MASLQMRNAFQGGPCAASIIELGCRSSRSPTAAPSSARQTFCFPPTSHGLRSHGGKSSSSGRSAAVSQQRLDVRRHAKFQQFTPSDGPTGDLDKLLTLEEDSKDDILPEDQRDDRVLPDSLEGAVLQSSESTALFIQSGGHRAIVQEAVGRAMLEKVLPHGKLFNRNSQSRVKTNPVVLKFALQVELLVPDMLNSGEEGDQLKLWSLARLFLEDLQSRLGTQVRPVMKVLTCCSMCAAIESNISDAGVAAMLKYQWRDATFTFASLNDRKPVDIDDEVVVLIQPDYQMLASVEKIASSLSDAIDSPPRPMVMYNPSLQSGEVGIGLNIRRMREFFLSTFNSVYSMRSLSFGAVFRRYPGLWQVFFDDEEVLGRYVLVEENAIRPVLEDVEMLFLTRGKGKDGDHEDKEPSPLQNLVGVLSSMGRFMQSLSR